jgi:hypothetical protein
LATQILCRGFPFAENNYESVPYQFDQVFDGGLYGALRQGKKAYLSGPTHQKYWIYRKDAEAAKGRKEDHPWVR